MTDPRYAVPLEELESVHVEVAHQVPVQREPVLDAGASVGALHTYGDGATGADADGD
jgi:hypothetical protein